MRESLRVFRRVPLVGSGFVTAVAEGGAWRPESQGSTKVVWVAVLPESWRPSGEGSTRAVWVVGVREAHRTVGFAHA